MKSILILLLFVFSGLLYGQTTSLTTTFKFTGIEEGYDHLCKTQVWVDGTLAGESKEVKESAGGSFTVYVPTGAHMVRVVNLAFYEDTWEEHTIDNQYSIDCLWEGDYTFGAKGAKLFLLFDIDNGTLESWKKMPKAPK